MCGTADRHFSERAGADQCARDDGYNSRGHRFGQFYDKLCCACATKRGFDLTIANHGGACGNCLARNIQDLSAHPHLHLDTLCAKLSRMIYESEDMQNTVQARLKEHFEITAHNKLGGDKKTDADGQASAQSFKKFGRRGKNVGQIKIHVMSFQLQE